MLARESGEWERAAECAQAMQLSENEIAEAYWQAMAWAREVSAGS
jgi:hypothetical protein